MTIIIKILLNLLISSENKRQFGLDVGLYFLIYRFFFTRKLPKAHDFWLHHVILGVLTC